MTARRRPVASVAAAVSLIGLYFWDDALLAAPIVAASHVWGALPTFFVLGSVYWLASWVIAVVVMRILDRRTAGAAEPSRLERWIEGQTSGRRGRWIERAMTSGKVIGFVACSFLLGGVVTTWFARYVGHREHITFIAGLSSAIFAVTFVGVYSGLSKVLLGG